MVQVIEQTTPFGKLAESFGKGLGEGIETSAQQSFKAQGLRSIADQAKKAGGVSNLDLYSQLLSIPGMTSAEAQQAIPFLRESIQAEQFRQQPGQGSLSVVDMTLRDPSFGEKTSAIDVDTVQEINQSQPDTTDVATGKTEAEILGYDPSTLTTLEAVETARQSLPVVDERQIDQLAGQLMRENPTRFDTIDRARDYAEKMLNQDVRRKEAVLARRGSELQIVSDFTSSFDKRLQDSVGENYKGELDRVYARLKDEGEKLIQSGKLTPEAAAKRQAKIAENFVKTRGVLQELGTASIIGRPSEKVMQQMANVRGAYDRAGALDLYAEELQTKNGLSPHLAKTLAYPPNPELSKKLDALKPFQSQLTYSTDQRERKNQSRKRAEDIVKSIESSDSLDAIALAFNDKNLDESVFYDVVQDAVNSGELALTDIQNDELTRRENVTSSLADIFFTSISGLLGKQNQVSSRTKLSRTLLGKR